MPTATISKPRIKPTSSTRSASKVKTAKAETVAEPTFCDAKAATRAQKLLHKQLPPTRAASLAAMMNAFGDATRLRLLFLLAQNELCVCDLSALLQISQSGVSHQLRALKTLRLVRSRRDGRNIYYAVADDHVAEILRVGLEHVGEKPAND